MSFLDMLSGNVRAGDIVDKGEAFWYGASGGVPKPSSGVDVDPDSAMRCAAAYSCTRAIAETLASLPPIVYEQIDSSARDRARDNPMYRLLHDQPNPEMDSMQFIELMTQRLVNRGNAFAEIVRNENGEPVELVPIHNSRVRPWRTPGRREGGRYFPGEIEWQISVSDFAQYRTTEDRFYVIPDEDMLNVVGFNSQDGLLAPGVVAIASEEIGLNSATQLYGASFFGNGARPAGIVEHPGFPPNPEERTEFRADINRIHRTNENWHSVGVLWGGAQWKELQVSPEQAQMIDTRKLSAKVICQYYGVPPAIIQIFDDFKFSTVEAMLKQFVMLTIRPYAIRWERAIGTQILSQLDDDLLLEFALNALLRGDPLAQAQANEIKFRNGTLGIDEWRAQDNLNPLPDGIGQNHFMPLNYAPLEQVVAGAGVVAGTTKSTDDSSRQNNEMQEFAERVISESFERMQAIESKAILRAAKEPGTFLETIETFYKRFVQNLSDAIESGVDGWLKATKAAEEIDSETHAFSQSHKYCNCSRDQLIEVSGCPADEFVARVTECVNGWSSRTLSMLESSKEETNDQDE